MCRRIFGEKQGSGHGDHHHGGGVVIRFYSPPVSEDEALSPWLPRQKDRTETEAIRQEHVEAPEPKRVSAPG